MNARTLILFAILCVFWGIPYFFIKLALVDISPVCVAWSRIALGAIVLIPVAWHRGVLGPALRHKGPIIAFAIAELVIPFSLIAIGERSLSSSMVGVLIATVPLTVVIVAPLFGVHESMSLRRLLGLMIGFAGIITLLGFDSIAGTAQWLAVAGLAVAVAGYAAGPLIVQKYLKGVDEVGAVALSLGVAAVLLLPFAVLTLPQRLPSAVSLTSIGVLGLVCTAGAMLLYFYVIHAAGAARASVVAYISPAIAAVLGVAVLHEPLGVGIVLGLALILLGSALGSSGADRAHAESPPESVGRPHPHDRSAARRADT